MKHTVFPLVLIGIGEVIEGATRLQKYAFLSSMKIKSLQKINFYDDWKASNYGPYSARLARELELVIQECHVEKYSIENNYGYKVERFTLSKSGILILNEFKNIQPTEYKKMAEIVSLYQKKTLTELLQDVYFQFPQFAKNSKIKQEMGQKIYESESYLSTKYDYPDN